MNEWRQGSPIRQAAINARMPEGTVTRFYALFNRNPEKYRGESKQTQAQELRQEETSVNYQLHQVVRFKGILSVMKTYRALMKEQKYLEAKTLLEAEQAMAEFTESKVEEIKGISAYAWYCSDPEHYAYLIPNVVEEISRQIRDLDLSPHDGRSILETMDNGKPGSGERKSWQLLQKEFEKVIPQSNDKTRFENSMKDLRAMRRQGQERLERGEASELDKILLYGRPKKRRNVGNRK